jgi:hypothetical protein
MYTVGNSNREQTEGHERREVVKEGGSGASQASVKKKREKRRKEGNASKTRLIVVCSKSGLLPPNTHTFFSPAHI